MADSFGLKDVSSKDTGKGSKLKTGNSRRSYKMAKDVKKYMGKKMPTKGWKSGSKKLAKGVCPPGFKKSKGKCVPDALKKSK